MRRPRDPVARTPLLQVRNLKVLIRADGKHQIRTLEDVELDVFSGETLGLLGESGAGKTTLALAILRLLPTSSYAVEGSVKFQGVQLLTRSEHELRRIRGSKISIVYQDPSVLNPALRVGDQIGEVLRAHFTWRRRQYRDKAMSLLRDVEMQDAERIYASFPHQLSGGQRQRIVIAQALACQPALVIADEPTASLDVDTTSEILGLLSRLKRRFDTSFLLISHEISTLTGLSDRIIIMYAGRLVERGSRGEMLKGPLHPYTRALFQCGSLLRMRNVRETGGCRLPTIAGRSPDPSVATLGCDFENRCPERMSICRTRIPGETHVSNAHTVRCFKFGG
jgi:peptide/nickel transport system ATP-binding protein